MALEAESLPELAEDNADERRDGSRRRRSLLAAAVFVLFAAIAGLLVARGGESEDTVALAAARMSGVSSYRAEVRMQTSASDQDRDSPGIVVEVVEDVEEQRSRWVWRPPPEIGGETEILSIDGISYVQLSPGLQERTGAQTPWVAYPRSTDNTSDEALSAASAVDRLRQASGANADPVHVGKEDVRGVATKRYEVELTGEDARRYVDQQDRPSDDLVRTGQRVTLSVWVDDDHLMRRYRSITTFSVEDPDDPPEERKPVEYQQRFMADYYDFGVEVPAFAPPPEEEITFFESHAAFNEKLQAALTRN